MSLVIKQTDNASEIMPILRGLRDKSHPAIFEQRLKDALSDGYRALIARDNDMDLGALGYRLTRDVYWGKTLYIDDLVVHPSARGRTIGTELLNHAKRLATEQGCDHVRLCSGLDRSDAHRFYDRNNFSRSSLQFAYVVPKGDA